MAEFLKAKPTSFVNRPRVIVDTRTGEGEVYEQVARLGDEMARMGFEEAVVEQEQIGKDYVASLQTRDDQGKLQFVELPESLSKVAKRAATPELQRRYSNELQLDTSNKIAEFHRLYKDDPIAFERQSNLYITETINTLRGNGYGNVAGDYATNAAGLVVQHSNDLKLKAFKKQEEVANEKQRIVIDNNTQDSYELRIAGKTEEADKIYQATIVLLDDLIEKDAVNAPYYKEQKAKLLTGKRQAVMELEFIKFNGNAAQMAAYNRSLTLGKISADDKALLPNLTDQHFIDQRKDLRPEDIRLLTAWASTTKGRFADGYSETKKNYDVENTGVAWQNKTLSEKSTTASKDLDLVIGQDIGINRPVKPIDIIQSSKEQINIITGGQKGNATVPNAVKQVVNNPIITKTHIQKLKETGNIDEANRSVGNYINISKSTAGLIGIEDTQTAKALTVETLIESGINATEAFESVHRDAAEQKAINEEVKQKIFESDSSYNEDNYNLNNFIKKKLDGLGVDLDTFERQKLFPVMKFALEARGTSIDDAIDVVEKYIENVYVEHPSNFNLYERKTGTPDRGGIKSYYRDQTDKVENIVNKRLKDTVGSIETVVPLTEMGGETTLTKTFELGENAFLLPDPSNGNTGQGRWTVVDRDGKLIMDEFGPIEITTKDIELKLYEDYSETAKEAIAEETLGKYFSWWRKLSFGGSIRDVLQGKGVDMDAPAPSIDTFDNADKPELFKNLYKQPTGSEMIENVDVQPDVMRNITDVVDEAIDTVDRNVVQPVITGVETAVDIVQEEAGKLKDIAVNNIISLYNNMKAYGAEILRDTPEFIEISQLANGQVIDQLVNSITANKPINAHVGAVEQLIKDEDFSNVPYQDGKGKSIGYGFAIAALEDDERALIKDINNITEKEAKAVINKKVKKIADKFARDVKNFDTLSVTRQVALINFAYQLGYENVTNQGKDPQRQWPKFFSMLKVAANLPAGSEDRDNMFAKVRDNMLYNYSSKGKTYTDWFTQTPNRAKRVAKSIRGY